MLNNFMLTFKSLCLRYPSIFFTTTGFTDIKENCRIFDPTNIINCSYF